MDPLQLDPAWPSAVPLIDLETALEQSLLQSGLSRQDYIKRLAQDLHKPRLQPLLWLLPRRWRLAPAQLPQQLPGESLVQTPRRRPRHMHAQRRKLGSAFPNWGTAT